MIVFTKTGKYFVDGLLSAMEKTFNFCAGMVKELPPTETLEFMGIVGKMPCSFKDASTIGTAILGMTDAEVRVFGSQYENTCDELKKFVQAYDDRRNEEMKQKFMQMMTGAMGKSMTEGPAGEKFKGTMKVLSLDEIVDGMKEGKDIEEIVSGADGTELNPNHVTLH